MVKRNRATIFDALLPEYSAASLSTSCPTTSAKGVHIEYSSLHVSSTSYFVPSAFKICTMQSTPAARTKQLKFLESAMMVASKKQGWLVGALFYSASSSASCLVKLFRSFVLLQVAALKGCNPFTCSGMLLSREDLDLHVTV